MRFLFIVPPDSHEGRYRLSSNSGITVPLGIAQLAAVLEAQGYHVDVLDMRIDDNNDAIRRAISRSKPDAIGMSVSLFSRRNVLRQCRHIRSILKVPIIIGGPYPSVDPASYMGENPFCDIVILHDGEYTLGKVLRRIKEGELPSGIPGIAYRDSGTIRVGKGSPPALDPNILPYPAFHLFDFSRYRPHPKHYRNYPVLPMITQRGCPWGRCTFCYQPSKASRRLSPSNAVDQILFFKRHYGIKEVRFWDDIFLDDRRWIYEFCDELEKSNLQITWGCNARVDTVDEELLGKIRQAGCWQILYGIESGNQKLLHKIGKGSTLSQIRNAVSLTKKAGISVRASFMLGLPGETPAIADETIRLAEELDADITQFCLATPYPGTRMYEQVKDSGRLDTHLDNFSEIKVAYLPEGYASREELQDKFRQAYARIYFKPGYIAKNLLSVRNREDMLRYYNGLKAVLGMVFKNKE